MDFKIEFGRQGKTIRLGDEISMDSMRLWDKKTKESLDKDVYRFNKGDVMATYNRVAQQDHECGCTPCSSEEKNSGTKERSWIQKAGGCKTKGKKAITSRIIQRTGKRSQRLTSLMHTL